MGEVGGKFNISDLIPILKPFDVQGIERKMKHIKNRAENSLSIILNEYRNKKNIVTNSNVTDFVETLLSYDGKLDERSIMGVLAVRTHHCNQYFLQNVRFTFLVFSSNFIMYILFGSCIVCFFCYRI
jgi:hypothetical protein